MMPLSVYAQYGAIMRSSCKILQHHRCYFNNTRLVRDFLDDVGPENRLQDILKPFGHLGRLT